MEVGAEVQFEITDVETMVREVVDHQDILRSLGRTLITKTLTKKTVQALNKDKVDCRHRTGDSRSRIIND